MRDDKPTFDVDRPMWDVVGSLPETDPSLEDYVRRGILCKCKCVVCGWVDGFLVSLVSDAEESKKRLLGWCENCQEQGEFSRVKTDEKQEAIEELRKSLAGIVEWQRINRWEHNAAHNEAVRVLRMTAKFGNKDKEVRQFCCPCGREFGINDCVGIVMCPVCGNAGLDILVRFNLDRKGMDV